MLRMKHDILLLLPLRGDREECHFGFPSLTFQNPEEGGNRPPKRRIMNKKIV